MKHISTETQALVWTVFAAENYQLNFINIKQRLPLHLQQTLTKSDIQDIIKSFEYQLYILEEELKYKAIYGEYY